MAALDRNAGLFLVAARLQSVSQPNLCRLQIESTALIPSSQYCHEIERNAQTQGGPGETCVLCYLRRAACVLRCVTKAQ